MTILAFDTCLQACSVAVLKPGEDECVHVTDTIGRGHAEVLLPMIQGVLEQADLTFSDIGQLAVTLGPGAFTGVRVGISTARGVCVGLDLNAIGYTSLHVMAREVLDVIGTNELKAFERIAVLSDARRDEVYGQYFDRLARPLDEAFVSKVDHIEDQLQECETLVIGSGGSLLSEGGRVKILLPDLLPNSVYLAKLASEGHDGFEEIKPLYLRAPDAKPQSGKRVVRAHV